MLSPFSIILIHRLAGSVTRRWDLWGSAPGLLVLLGLLFSSSRAAWLAVVIALCAWLFWVWLSSLSQRLHIRPAVLFGLGVAVALAAVFVLGTVQPGGISNLVDRLPGPNSSISRMQIYTNTRWLIADFPFTGGGLASFPGLYSYFVMRMPVFLFGYAHDLFLDLALEQGIIGLLSFVFILIGSFWLIMGRESAELLDGACAGGTGGNGGARPG